MRKSKDLSVCISVLEDLQRRGSVNSEQRKAVGHVVDELKRIRRKPTLERHEQNESIRNIVEELIRAFTKRD
jgi:chemotaxis signal transduction protein